MGYVIAQAYSKDLLYNSKLYFFCIFTPLPRFAAAGLPAHTGFGIQQQPLLVYQRSTNPFLSGSGCFRLAELLPSLSLQQHHLARARLPTSLAGSYWLQTVTTNVIRKEEKGEEKTGFLCCLFKIVR